MELISVARLVLATGTPKSEGPFNTSVTDYLDKQDFRFRGWYLLSSYKIKVKWVHTYLHPALRFGPNIPNLQEKKMEKAGYLNFKFLIQHSILSRIKMWKSKTLLFKLNLELNKQTDIKIFILSEALLELRSRNFITLGSSKKPT